jgi:hypothetical protein
MMEVFNCRAVIHRLETPPDHTPVPPEPEIAPGGPVEIPYNPPMEAPVPPPQEIPQEQPPELR